MCISCGISEEQYLSPIDPSTITRSFNTSAVIKGVPSETGVRTFLYYKIYVSGASESATINQENMSAINGAMLSDYNGILPYTPLNTTTTQVFSANVFASRNYYMLLIGGAESFSYNSAVNITLDFATGKAPSSEVDTNGAVAITRSNGSGVFTPLPENSREFYNFAELNNSQNRDVSTNSAVTSPQYTYCMIYIVRRKVDPSTLAPVFSAPTFVGVFRLPDNN